MKERFNKYFDVISGYAFKSNDLNSDGEILVIKIGNISNGEDVVKDNASQYVSSDFMVIDERYHVKKGDVLISLTGSHINQPNSMVGRTCRSYSDKTFLLNQRAGKIILKNDISLDYIYYLLSLKSIQESIVTRAYGAANQVNISPSAIGNIKWDFPNKTIQNRIGEILSRYDELIVINNKRIKILEQMAENLYKEWFVRFRFPGHEDVEFENGIPKGWEIKRIYEFGRIETGKTPSMEKADNYGDKYLFIKTPDMHGVSYVINTDEKLSEIGHLTQPKKLLPAGSIMVSCIGTGGVVAINAVQGHTNQQINSIVLKDEKQREWLFYTCKMLKPTIEMFGATGTTMTNLSKGKFERLKVLYPTERLVIKFHDIVEPILLDIKRLLYVNRNLIKQRDLLLPRLMSGKLEIK